jgi:hypothetical protein
VADSGDCNRICKIATNGIATVYVNVRPCGYGSALGQIVSDPSGNLYVGYVESVSMIQTNGSVVSVGGPDCFCGTAWSAYVGPGIDAATNIYAAAGVNLWMIVPGGAVDLFAGGASTFSDGPRLECGYQDLVDVAVNAATNFFLSDSFRIRQISPVGWVSTIAGTGLQGYLNGRGPTAEFNRAVGLCLDTNGNIYVADSGNNCIREISPDTYGIGIADWWQLKYFGYVGIDPNADPDGDGMSNYAEFWAGTNPLDPNSNLSINTSSLISGNHAQISWQTVAGKTYTVQYSTNLVSWNALGTAVVGNGTLATVTDPSAIPQYGSRYYRIALTGF